MIKYLNEESKNELYKIEKRCFIEDGSINQDIKSDVVSQRLSLFINTVKRLNSGHL